MFAKGFIPLLLIVFISLFFYSCATEMAVVGEDWNEEMFFKSAQESFDDDALDQALFYYDVYLLRYPSNIQKGIAAEYEIAYLYYKKGDLEKSQELFQLLLERYEKDSKSYLYPSAYRVLSEKVLTTIEEKIVIRELPFFQRSRAEKERMGTDRDTPPEAEVDQM